MKMPQIVIIPSHTVDSNVYFEYLMLFHTSIKEQLPVPYDAQGFSGTVFGWSPYNAYYYDSGVEDWVVAMADAGYLGWYIEAEYLHSLEVDYLKVATLEDLPLEDILEATNLAKTQEKLQEVLEFVTNRASTMSQAHCVAYLQNAIKLLPNV